jgi:uncharacterized protein HemX
MSNDTHGATAPKRRRPTGWIVTAAVLAVVAVGLGIWAFGAQSDADDAQAKLDAQEQAASAGESQPAEIDADEIQQRFEDVKTELGITGESLEQLTDEVNEAVADLDKAEQARTDAAGAIDRATAEVDAFRAQATVAKTCLRGAFDALDAAFSAGGMEAVVTQLEALSGDCRSAASP